MAGFLQTIAVLLHVMGCEGHNIGDADVRPQGILQQKTAGQIVSNNLE